MAQRLLLYKTADERDKIGEDAVIVHQLRMPLHAIDRQVFMMKLLDRPIFSCGIHPKLRLRCYDALMMKAVDLCIWRHQRMQPAAL